MRQKNTLYKNKHGTSANECKAQNGTRKKQTHFSEANSHGDQIWQNIWYQRDSWGVCVQIVDKLKIVTLSERCLSSSSDGKLSMLSRQIKKAKTSIFTVNTTVCSTKAKGFVVSATNFTFSWTEYKQKQKYHFNITSRTKY